MSTDKRWSSVERSCPMCGQFGASMSSTEWGHNWSCCSDKCGHAFRDSPQRARRELESAQINLRLAQAGVERWEREVAKWEQRIALDEGTL